MKRLLLIILFIANVSHCANAQVLTKIDKATPFQNGFGGVKKGNTWGFIDDKGKLLIEYRNDIVVSPDGAPIISDGLCLIQEVRDGITFYGYINVKGEKVIPADYLAATPFENGYARVIKYYKEDTGTTNALGKNIVNYSYNELVINTNNETIQHLRGPNHLLFDKLYLQKNPAVITSTFINDNLIAVRENDNTYTVYKLNM
jgi:hypothetical protein